MVGASVSMGASVLLPVVMALADSAALGDAVSETSVVVDAVVDSSVSLLVPSPPGVGVGSWVRRECFFVAT
jgi:hypothetical protein